MTGINPLLVPVWLLTAVLFFAGWKYAGTPANRIILFLIGILAAAPAIVFAIFYTGLLGEAEWFYRFRSWPYTELAAAGVGFVAGGLERWRGQSVRLRKYTSALFIPFLVLLLVTVPYLKQIVLRPAWDTFEDKWMDGVCLQSSESSCGPASAATLLRSLGITVTEKEIAQASYTTRRGTENWYLIRTLRRLGLKVDYRVMKPDVNALPFPAIVGVRLDGPTGPGHFIAILGKTGDQYIVGDPMRGREVVGASRLLDRYYFTGFSMVAESPNRGSITP